MQLHPSSQPHFLIKEMRPYAIKKERGHGGVAILVELSAVAQDVEE